MENTYKKSKNYQTGGGIFIKIVDIILQFMFVATVCLFILMGLLTLCEYEDRNKEAERQRSVQMGQ